MGLIGEGRRRRRSLREGSKCFCAFFVFGVGIYGCMYCICNEVSLI